MRVVIFAHDRRSAYQTVDRVGSSRRHVTVTVIQRLKIRRNPKINESRQT